MLKKPHKLKMSIKAKILRILIVVLFLSLAAHLSVFYYTTANVKNMIQNAIENIYNFENKANLDLKDSILNRFVMMDLQSYTDYIDRKVEEQKSAGGRKGESEKSRKIPKKMTEKEIAKIINLKQLLEVEKHRPGYIFIINAQGKVIATEGAAEEDLYKQYIEYGKNLQGSGNKSLSEAVQSMIKSDEDSGVIKKTIDNKEFFFVFSRIESIDGILVEVLLGDYLNGHVNIVDEKIDAYMRAIRNNFIFFYNKINYVTLAVFVSIIFISYVIGSSLAKTFATPLIQLKEATRYIGQGNLMGKIDIKTGDEIEELSDNFNLMTADLKTYINKLSESIAREKSIEEEIKLAARIQKSSLPEGVPVFEPDSRVDLSAYIKPTKIVSGDFYDYFAIDEHHLFFAVGDVSGKSISAALFMMTTKILMKRFALMKVTPDEILKDVNDTLALDNPTCMYATIFCGILDIRSGCLHYCNGGHVYPLIFDGNGFNYLKTEENMLVGLTSRAEFKSEALQMKEGDILFVYSDGVTEAKNVAGDLYSEPKLAETLNKSDREKSSSVIENVRGDVLAFSRDAEQYDDITMLCVKFLGKIVK